MVMRHRLLNVTVDRVPFNPSVLGSLLSPASLGIPGAGIDGLSVGGGGGGGVEAATAAGSMLGPLVSSMAADIFRQAVGGDEWAMADVDDDEEELESSLSSSLSMLGREDAYATQVKCQTSHEGGRG